MARIYAGALTNIDLDVVKRLQSELPDDFTVLAELNIERNVDLVILRPLDRRPAVLIAAELKRVWHPIRGQTDGVWSELRGGDWRPIRPRHALDINHHWQAVNAADALKRWLWMNQRRFLSTQGGLQGWQVRVWPHLVLYGVNNDEHDLPKEPATRFGRWFFDVDTWIHELLTWQPSEGMCLRQAEIDHLVEALGLLHLPDEDALAALTVNVDEDSVAQTVRDLHRRVEALELLLLGVDGNRPARDLVAV